MILSDYYKDLIDNLTVDDIKTLLNKLEVPYKETEDYLLCPTVCHNEDPESASWKLYYYKDNHFFFCYTNCQSMSVFKFLENFYQTRDIEYNWYEDVYSVIANISNFSLSTFKKEKRILLKEKYQRREEPILKTYPSGILDIFTRYYAVEWLNDGITKETMDKFNILFSTSRNKIIIPHYNINGELIGIRGRALNPEEVEIFGKYMPIKIEDKWYSHPLSLNLYGLNITQDNIKNNGICFLFEGEKSIMQCDGFNQPNCAAAVCGSNLNIYQVRLLMKTCHPKEIVICFDNEELPGKDEYFNKLLEISKKYKKYCNFSFIYDRRGLTKLKDSPSDNGEEIFLKLVEERIKVK